VFVGKGNESPKTKEAPEHLTFEQLYPEAVIDSRRGNKSKGSTLLLSVFGLQREKRGRRDATYRRFSDTTPSWLDSSLSKAMFDQVGKGTGTTPPWTFTWPPNERPDSSHAQASDLSRLPPKVKKNIFGKLLPLGPLFERFGSWRDALRDRTVQRREPLLDTIFNPDPTSWRRVGSLCLPTPPLPYDNLAEISRPPKIAIESLSAPWLRVNSRRPAISIAPNYRTASFLWLPV
jgi:hypothetical protein